ncbi:TnsA endonuclease C-terminal domain-containing protein [Paraburkholderia xenovorans]|uniref:TnsA endonuclease C-terminal domain-containing protein n=1 Tax=Paraburkholderia xenovorans TaxID=36873 RepID=UPI0038BABF8A
MSTKTVKMKMNTIHRKLKEQEDARKAGIYLRWIHTRDMPGSGIKTRLVCEKAAADELHLMSEAEHAAFLEAWWRADVETIYDHQALDREKTQRAALCINIDHPTYVGRTEPVVLSTDLVLNVRRGSTYKKEAISVRSLRIDVSTTPTRAQLIERRTWEDEGAIFKAVAFHGMHKNRSRNLAWIFRAHNDTVGRQLSASELKAQSELIRILRSRRDMRVVDACRYVDSKLQLPSGSGVQAFRQLAGRKALAFDLTTSDPVRLLIGDIREPKRSA